MVANHDDAYADCVRVVPRRKAGEPRRARNHNKNNALFLTKDLLVQFYDIPLPEAAELLVRIYSPPITLSFLCRSLRYSLLKF